MKLLQLVLATCVAALVWGPGIIDLVGATQCETLLPGLDKQALGIDVTSMDLMPKDKLHGDDGYKGRLFTYTCNEGKKRQFDGKTYDIPDQVWSVTDEPSGVASSQVSVMQTTEQARNAFGVTAGVGVDAEKYAFSASFSYSKTQETILKQDRKVEKVYGAYSSRRAILKQKQDQNLGTEAQRAVNNLPSTYAANYAAYEDFLKTYGTHYIKQATFGGVIVIYLETKSQYFEESTTESVEVSVSGTYKAVTASLGVTNENSNVDSKFTSDTKRTIQYYGGDANLLEANGFKAWQPTINGKPWLLTTQLGLISDLIKDTGKSAAMKEAIVDYMRRIFVTVELQRILRTLPSHIQSNNEVSGLLGQLEAEGKKYPMDNSRVESLETEVRSVYVRLFTEYYNSLNQNVGANSIMGNVDFKCGAGQSITRVSSSHSDWHDDRTWYYKCSYLPNLYSLANCQTTGNLYNLGTHSWQYSCQGNRVVKGWKSQHHDWWDTRVHQLVCCDVANAQTALSCSWTGWTNGYMGYQNFQAQESVEVIRGVKGQHSGWHDDDVWAFEKCRFQ